MKKPKWDFEWDNGMSVGIPEIDEDHKRFISLMTTLIAPSPSGRKRLKSIDACNF